MATSQSKPMLVFSVLSQFFQGGVTQFSDAATRCLQLLAHRCGKILQGDLSLRVFLLASLQHFQPAQPSTCQIGDLDNGSVNGFRFPEG